MPTRTISGLAIPPADLGNFPAHRLGPATRLYRAHALDRSPWWFASGVHGRFDLSSPDGTCYVATTLATALKERLGPRVVRTGIVHAAELERTIVSRVALPEPCQVANALSHRAYAFGMTTEIGTSIDYALTRSWATALWGRGLAGVRYVSRLAPTGVNVALFGASGSRDWPSNQRSRSALSVARTFGLQIVQTPEPGSIRAATPGS